MAKFLSWIRKLIWAVGFWSIFFFKMFYIFTILVMKVDKLLKVYAKYINILTGWSILLTEIIR